VDHSRVKLIKFDLEGGELGALKGAVKALSKGRPLILFEYGNLDAYGDDSGDYIQFFNTHGYGIVDAFNFELVDQAQLRSTIGWNLFAIPREIVRIREFVSALITASSK
jgi:hypothetical protein